MVEWSRKGKKGSIPSWDPHLSRGILTVGQAVSALGMLPRCKRHLKKQT